MTGKGILKYLAYVFIGGWMFLLGIMVGRGSMPISFDTSGLHERLADIVGSKSNEPSQEVELGFYDALDEPDDPDIMTMKVKPRKPDLLGKQKMDITLAPVEDEPSEKNRNSQQKFSQNFRPAPSDSAEDGLQLPRKKAKKAATLNREALDRFKAAPYYQDKKNLQEASSSSTPAGKKPSQKISLPSASPEKPAPDAPKIYTIQLASFKDPKDAQTYISQLQKKGFSAAMEPKKIESRTWNRVYLGRFPDHDQAEKRLEELKKAQIDGFIIQIKDNKK